MEVDGMAPASALPRPCVVTPPGGEILKKSVQQLKVAKDIAELCRTRFWMMWQDYQQLHVLIRSIRRFGPFGLDKGGMNESTPRKMLVKSMWTFLNSLLMMSHVLLPCANFW